MISRTSNPGNKSARRGITILETMIAVTGVALMLGLCAVTLQLLMRLNGENQTRLGAAMVFERLARQLRADVHAAETVVVSTAQPGGKPANLRVTLEPAHVILYEVLDTSIVRLESRDGKRVRHESYNLLRGRTGIFELRDESGRQLASLVVTYGAGTGRTDPPRPMEVLALVGKDRTRVLGKGGGIP
jgi:hypothetical protein